MDRETWEKTVTRCTRARNLLEIAAGISARVTFDKYRVTWETQIIDPSGRMHEPFHYTMTLIEASRFQGDLGNLLADLVAAKKQDRGRVVAEHQVAARRATNG